MNPWAISLRCVALGILIALAVLSWPAHNPFPAEANSSGAAQALPHHANPSLAAPPAHARAPALENFLASIHSQLLQWSETQTGDKNTQDRLMNGLLALLTDDNASIILRSLSPDELDTPFASAALRRWLQADPAHAARWIAASPNATEAHAWVVAQTLAENNASLPNFCDQLPDTPWKQNLLNYAGLDVLSQDPVAAISLAQRMNPGPPQTSLLQTVACDWIGRDPAAAMGWIMSVNDPSLRDQLVAAGAKSMATTDPDQAADWLVTTVQSEQVLHDTALSIVETWAAQDPAMVAGWVTQFPDGSTRSAALAIVSRYWLQSDPAAAAAWMQDLPEYNETHDPSDPDQAPEAYNSPGDHESAQ